MLASLLPVTLFSYGSAQDTSLTTVQAAFDSADIPTDAGVTFDPQTLLEVSFIQPSGTPPVNVTAGNAVAQNATALPPVFGDMFANPTTNVSQFTDTKFVLAMFDLDAPTPQNRSLSQIRHFLGADFTLNQTDGGSLLFTNSTPALSEYVQPGPPPGSDPHRYVFLLFTQPTNFTTAAASAFVNASTPITNFNISVFAAEMGLGNPIGGSFMKVGPAPSSNTTSGSGSGGNSTSGSNINANEAAGGAGNVLGLSMTMAFAMALISSII
ncbi:PEBP-like protein [Schizopora paradoxa]|uniref:PEBP-like protein n=1 Tax=Schizopora paradoxa TaxID=27342 RepID=A0A0H2SD45_9AGAM|nr:PEBP-like protein [Schizopora paradoxa]